MPMTFLNSLTFERITDVPGLGFELLVENGKASVSRIIQHIVRNNNSGKSPYFVAEET
jgi:GTP-binding protein EngB required for normal cell division